MKEIEKQRFRESIAGSPLGLRAIYAQGSIRPCGWTGWIECDMQGCNECPANLNNYSEEVLEQAKEDYIKFITSGVSVNTTGEK